MSKRTVIFFIALLIIAGAAVWLRPQWFGLKKNPKIIDYNPQNNAQNEAVEGQECTSEDGRKGTWKYGFAGGVLGRLTCFPLIYT